MVSGCVAESGVWHTCHPAGWSVVVLPSPEFDRQATPPVDQWLCCRVRSLTHMLPRRLVSGCVAESAVWRTGHPAGWSVVVLPSPEFDGQATPRVGQWLCCRVRSLTDRPPRRLVSGCVAESGVWRTGHPAGWSVVVLPSPEFDGQATPPVGQWLCYQVRSLTDRPPRGLVSGCVTKSGVWRTGHPAGWSVVVLPSPEFDGQATPRVGQWLCCRVRCLTDRPPAGWSVVVLPSPEFDGQATPPVGQWLCCRVRSLTDRPSRRLVSGCEIALGDDKLLSVRSNKDMCCLSRN